MQSAFLLQILFYTAAAFGLIVLIVGINLIQSGSKSPYYRIRQRRTSEGWRAIIIALIFAGIAFLISRYTTPFSILSLPISGTPTVTLAADPSAPPELTQTPAAFFTETPGSSPVAGLTVTLESSPGSTATLTPFLSPTWSLTQTALPWATSTISMTPPPTSTMKPSLTPSLTPTHAPSLTPAPPVTSYPTWTAVFNTPTPTNTHAPTLTPAISSTPVPTSTIKASLTPTITLTRLPTATELIIPTFAP